MNDYNRRLAAIASRRDRFNLPRDSWDERDWKQHRLEAERELRSRPELPGLPVYQPPILAPVWGLHPPKPGAARSAVVDEVLAAYGVKPRR